MDKGTEREKRDTLSPQDKTLMDENDIEGAEIVYTRRSEVETPQVESQEMAVSMNEYLSEVLCKLLDGYGLDERSRKYRMECQKMEQLLTSWGFESVTGGLSVLLGGSSYETTTIDGLSSDMDMIFIPHNICVIDDIQHWKPVKGGLTYMMDNTRCYKGYVKLYLLSPHSPTPLYRNMLRDIPAGHIADEDGKILMCNNCTTKEIQKDFSVTTKPDGPALTVNVVVDMDIVPTLICKSFPREAEEWKRRQTVQTRVKMGGDFTHLATHCYLVGVGNKGSPTENVEWRLSFSHIERELVHAWTNVQYKCYVMMKFIHKDLIKGRIPDHILDSYRFKTALMWMVEEYPVEFFTESNFNVCMLELLNNLLGCVKQRSFPHYFTEGCDLFHNRLGDRSGEEIATLLGSIIDTWPFCLFNIKRRSFGQRLEICLLHQVPVDIICLGICQDRKELSYTFDVKGEIYSLFLSYNQVKIAVLQKQYNEVFKLLLQLMQHLDRTRFYNSAESEHSITFMMKDILCNVGLHLIRHSDTLPNKAALYYKRLGMGFIQRCINDCTLDTHLKVAQYFTTTGNYPYALKMLDDIQNRIQAYCYHGCLHIGCRMPSALLYRMTLFDKVPSLKEYCKDYSAAPVTYTQDALHHVPGVLVFEMFRTTSVSPPVSDQELYYWYKHAVIHCPMYLYYLRFLCFRALGRYGERQLALFKMTTSSGQLQTMDASHTETNHNILGVCYRTLGQLNKAYIEYKKSLAKQKYHNAAIWHLALLLRSKAKPNIQTCQASWIIQEN